MKHYIYEIDGQRLVTSDIYREPPTSSGGLRVEIPIGMSVEQAQAALLNALNAYREIKVGNRKLDRNKHLFVEAKGGSEAATV